jgi:hypothetical protein
MASRPIGSPGGGALRVATKTVDVPERQRIARLLVKEILVSDDAIVLRHSIPAPLTGYHHFLNFLP